MQKSHPLLRILPVLALSILAFGCSDEGTGAGEFPSLFLWGTATAGFQVDMGCPNLDPAQCNDKRSDWYQWVMSRILRLCPLTFLSRQSVNLGPGHWELYPEDFRLARDDLRNNAFRMSLEWSRIFPSSTIGVTDYEDLRAIADPAALQHYHDVFAALKSRGIRPLVTINHYTLPRWIHKALACHFLMFKCKDYLPAGWADPDTLIPEIAKYAGFVAREFGGEVDLWATLNEPAGVFLSAYLTPSPTRTNPPGIFGIVLNVPEAVRTYQSMMVAHARMYDAVHANDTRDADGNGTAAMVGPVLNLAAYQPAKPGDVSDYTAAANADYFLNRLFPNAVVYGLWDENLDGYPETVRGDLAGRADYIGVNYYFKVAITGLPFSVGYPVLNFVPGAMTTYPEGLYQMILLTADYHLPSYVTETGIDDPLGNSTGPDYLVPHVMAVRQALQEGLDVRGFFYWSLMDNYEWNHGMNLKFGLYSVDPYNPEKTRVPKENAGVYAQIAGSNSIPEALIAQYGNQ